MKKTWLSNGLGGQSMYLLWAVLEGKIEAQASVTADTGSEEDCLMMDGTRITARDFWERHVAPICRQAGVEPLFVRARKKTGDDLPALQDVVRRSSEKARKGATWDEIVKGLSVPLFTADESMGRLAQTCTSKWKVAAIHQAARRAGVTHLCSIVGYHFDEAWRRINGVFIGTDENGFDRYRPYRMVKTPRGVERRTTKWAEQMYPLVDWRMGRADIAVEMSRLGMPYLVTSECDMCPHQDYARWSRHSPEVLEEWAKVEAGWGGRLYFTSKRKPLLEALAEMRQETPRPPQKTNALLFNTFGCGSELCGV